MLIQAWLKAGNLRGRQVGQEVERGTPQGGSISPLLANIYLHYVVDLWGSSGRSSHSFVAKQRWFGTPMTSACSSSTQPTWDTMRSLLEARLGQFGLKLAEEKTHQTNLGVRTNKETPTNGRKLTFLGFTIYRARSVGKTVIKTVFQTEGEALQPGESRNEGADTTDEGISPWRNRHSGSTRFCEGTLTTTGSPGMRRSSRAFWNFTWREWKHSLSTRSPEGPPKLGGL